MSRPSRDPHHFLKSRHQCQNPHSGSLSCHLESILTLNLTKNKIQKANVGVIVMGAGVY